jgi:hypothetical protein
MAEQLTLAEQIEHGPVEDDLDCAAAHNSEMLHRIGALADDRGPGPMLFDLDGIGNAMNPVGSKRIKRRVAQQKTGYLGRRGVGCAQATAGGAAA